MILQNVKLGEEDNEKPEDEIEKLQTRESKNFHQACKDNDAHTEHLKKVVAMLAKSLKAELKQKMETTDNYALKGKQTIAITKQMPKIMKLIETRRSC